MIVFVAQRNLDWPASNAVVFEILRRQVAGEPRLPASERGELRHCRKGEALPFDYPEVLLPGLVAIGWLKVVCRPAAPVLKVLGRVS